jgi:hypothetical protein
MGKCSFLITKGKKKGSKCGIYTSKIHDKKYLCAAHYKLVNEEIPDSESEEQSEKEIKKKIIKKSSGSKSQKKEVKKEIKKEVKKEESIEDSEDPISNEDEPEIKEIKREIKVDKKYKPYKPTEEDLMNKDLDELINEHDENEKDKPEKYLLLEKIDILIDKIFRLENFLMSNIVRPTRQKNNHKFDEPEIEVFD